MASCAIAWCTVPSTTGSANPMIAIALIFLSIVFLIGMGPFCQAAIDREYGGSRGRPFIAFKAGGLPMPSLGRRTTGPEFDKRSWKNFRTSPHSAATLPASLLNSFASGESLAQRSLPARAKLFGGFGVRHEEIESVEGTTHN